MALTQGPTAIRKDPEVMFSINYFQNVFLNAQGNSTKVLRVTAKQKHPKYASAVLHINTVSVSGCWLLFPNFARQQPSEVKRLMRDAASPGTPRIHSWKVTPCPRVLLREISGLLAMVETLGDA